MITRRDYWRTTAQHVAGQGVAKETCDLAAAEAADQFPTAFGVFVNFNDDKMTRSGMNTHHTLRCVCVCAPCGGGCTPSLVVSDEHSFSLVQVSRSELAGLTAALARPRSLEEGTPHRARRFEAPQKLTYFTHVGGEGQVCRTARGAPPVPNDARRRGRMPRVVPACRLTANGL